MAGFKFNPATGKFEVQQSGGTAPASPAAPAVGPATAKQPTMNIGKAKQTAVNIGQARPEQRRNFTASGPQPPAPPKMGTTPIGAPVVNPPMPANYQAPVQDPQVVINAMWQSVYDEAAEYKLANNGEDPPAGWWSARTAPIEAAQKRLDASIKSGGSGAAAAAKAAQAEAERIRKIRGGRQGEAFLIEEAANRKQEMLKRVAELYDPLKTKSAEDLKTVLQSASDAFDLAEQQVGEAQTNFEQQFRPSTAYQGVPISTFNVADNPLLAALQQQGASTGEVQAATDYARQMGQSTSDLEKWALNQLNVGQQNYGSAIQNAAQMGTMAALQQLSGRRADVKTGIQQQFADALAELAKNETAAKGNVDETVADLISAANKMRADTMADYGLLPFEEKKIKQEEDAALKTLEPKKKKPVVNKPKVVTPKVEETVVTKPNIKRNVR